MSRAVIPSVPSPDLHVDRDDLFLGQGPLGLFQQIAFGLAETAVDVVLREPGRPRHRLGIGEDAAILGFLDLGLFQRHGLEAGGGEIVVQSAALLRGLEDHLRGLVKCVEHGKASSRLGF